MAGADTGEPRRDEEPTAQDTPPAARAETDRSAEEVRPVFTGTGLYVGFVVLAALAIALAVFAAQNTESVAVAWTVFEFRTPLIVVILVTVVATAIATEVAGAIWRRNRRRVRNEREELSRLRGSPQASPRREA